MSAIEWTDQPVRWDGRPSLSRLEQLALDYRYRAGGCTHEPRHTDPGLCVRVIARAIRALEAKAE